jgi:arylsulfatase A-like enzyme
MGYDHCDYRWHDSCENICRDAAQHIGRRADGGDPFYLQVGLIEPHRRFDMYGGKPDRSLGVWVPPYIEEEPSAVEDFAGYQGAIHKMDASVAAILEAIESSGAAEDTVTILTTDHGIPFPKAKCSLYDAGLETALIMRWPAGGWTGGRVIDDPISNIDLLPTLLEMAGVEGSMEGSGQSFADLHSSRSLVFGEMTYHSYYDPKRCVRSDRYKLIANFSSAPHVQDPSQAWRPLTTPRPPGAVRTVHPEFELYDLQADPHELENRWEDEELRRERDRLTKELAEWCRQTEDQLLTDRPLNPQHDRVRSVLLAAL